MKAFKGFTGQQKRQLVGIWKRQSAQRAAVAFVDKVDHLIKIEAIAASTHRSETDFRNDCRAIAQHAKALAITLRKMPEVATVAGNAKEWIKTHEPMPGMTTSSREALQTMCRPENCGDIGEVFLHFLSGFFVTSQAMDLPQRPGPSSPLARYLVDEIVRHYRDEFGRLPATSTNGTFMAFMRDLSQIVGVEFGADIVKTTVDGCSKERPDVIVRVPFDAPLDDDVEGHVFGRSVAYTKKNDGD